MRAVALLCLAPIVFAACASSEDVTGDRRVVGNVTVTFTVTPGNVEVGRPVRLALRLTNNGGQPTDMTFPSGQRYDFWITEGDREIWRWSDETAFTQAVEEQTLGPQESVSFAESWTTTETGTLTAHGTVKANDFDRPLTGNLEVRG